MLDRLQRDYVHLEADMEGSRLAVWSERRAYDAQVLVTRAAANARAVAEAAQAAAEAEVRPRPRGARRVSLCLSNTHTHTISPLRRWRRSVRSMRSGLRRGARPRTRRP